MTTHDQQQFLTRIKAALNVSNSQTRSFDALFPQPSEETTQHLIEHIATRDSKAQQKLLDQLIKAGETINLEVIRADTISAAAAAIGDIARKKKPEWGQEKHITAWQHPLIDQLDLPSLLANQEIILHQTTSRENKPDDKERHRIREDITASFIGITSADYCVADSATLVMKTRPNQARSASLVPAIHIAVIRIDQIVADLKELYTLLRHGPGFAHESITNCLTFISGPSKTADIEAVMVHGAHGPRELHLVVTTDH